MSIVFATSKLITTVTSLAIKVVSPETEADAQKYLAKIRLAGKRLKEEIRSLKKPYDLEKKKIDAAAQPFQDLLQSKDQELEAAILAYRAKTRKAVGAYNARALDNYEKRVANAEAEAVAHDKALPFTMPPALKAEPATTVTTEVGTNIESGYWTWDGIKGVPGGIEGAKALTIMDARRLGLDLPDEWFYLDTAKVTACVKRNDRVPQCVLNRYQEKIVVRANHDAETQEATETENEAV